MPELSKLIEVLSSMHARWGIGTPTSIVLDVRDCKDGNVYGRLVNNLGDERFFRLEGSRVTYLSRVRRLNPKPGEPAEGVAVWDVSDAVADAKREGRKTVTIIMGEPVTHTPGPWTAGGWSSRSTPILAHDPKKGRGRVVANILCDFSTSVPLYSGNDSADYEGLTTKANIRLIESSPDAYKLLAALREWFKESGAGPSKHALFEEQTWEKALDDYFAKVDGE